MDRYDFAYMLVMLMFINILIMIYDNQVKIDSKINKINFTYQER